MIRIVLATLALIMAAGCANGSAAPLHPAKAIYENGVLTGQWKFSEGEGASLNATPAGVEFTIDKWIEERDMWPRISASGPLLDLTEYSQLIFEIENPSEIPQSICAAVNDNKGERNAIASQLPDRAVGRVILDISDGMPFDQSSIGEIVLYEFKPLHRVSYVLKKLTAIRNPDFIARRPALATRITQTSKALATLKNSMAAGAADARVADCEALLQKAAADHAGAVPGYAVTVQQNLTRAQGLIARTGLDLRQRDVWVWQSPLGLALRSDTLPSPVDDEVKAIQGTLCLNQYKIYCVNISAAKTAQKVTARLKNRAGQAGILSLRPALFAKARDGSFTADAVGEKTSEVSLEVAPYQSQQIMLWVDTKAAEARPGLIESAIELDGVSAAGTKFSRSIPVRLRIADVRLAAQLPLSVQNWAFFYMGNTTITAGLEKEAVANLRDYGATTWMTDYNQVPLPLVDANGRYAGMEPARLERLKQVLELVQCRPGEDFVTWIGLERAEMREALARPGVLEGYLKDLRALLDHYKVPADGRYLYLRDEPKLPELREGLELKRRIKALDLSFRFMDNGSAVPDGDTLTQFTALTDRWLPNWEQLYIARPADAQRLIGLNLPDLGFYRCLTSRNNMGVNVYEYYGLMGWYAMGHGLGTVGYWVHNAGEEDPWDGTKGAVSGVFSVYRRDGKLLTSRRYELFREGLEDYKLAQAAFGITGKLDARNIPQLRKMCEEVASRPDDLGYADKMRGQLIALAEER